MSEPILSILIPTIVGREDCFNKLSSSLKVQAMIETSPGIMNSGNNYYDLPEPNGKVFKVFDTVDFGRKIIECLGCYDDKSASIGEKRNKLLKHTNGKYLCFIDDDDSISNSYIKLLLGAAKTNCDCASLKGEITIDGGEPEIFEHSILYDKWETTNDTIKYLRFPNHLNMIRSDIAKQFKFPEKNHGEDFDWSTELHKSGLLKTEHYISETIYFYKFISNK